MMKFSLPLILALFFLTVSCQKEVTFNPENYQKSLADCEKMCPEISINVPIASNGGVVSDSINEKIFNVTKQIVSFQEKEFEAKSYADLTSVFISSYQKLQADFPGERFPWEAKINGKVGYTSEKIINIVIESYTFTGGAHGYSGTNSLLFDATTGKIIPIENLFNDSAKFSEYAESKFRKQFELSDSDNINATGLMFEDDKFSLPQNIIYTDKGLILYYNIYEIASYADGKKEVFIPYSELSPFLAIK